MDFADVEQRWQQYVNEFFAEQGMPEEFFYEARGDGEEPQLVLDIEHARVYAAWLATKGHITDIEHQWLASTAWQNQLFGLACPPPNICSQPHHTWQQEEHRCANHEVPAPP